MTEQHWYPSDVEPDRRHRMIQRAAYFRSRHRLLCEGTALDDWLAAEREIDESLAHAYQLARLGYPVRAIL